MKTLFQSQIHVNQEAFQRALLHGLLSEQINQRKLLAKMEQSSRDFDPALADEIRDSLAFAESVLPETSIQQFLILLKKERMS